MERHLSNTLKVAQYLSFDPDVKKNLGITPDLLRLSVGIEHLEDIINDIDQALEKCAS